MCDLKRVSPRGASAAIWRLLLAAGAVFAGLMATGYAATPLEQQIANGIFLIARPGLRDPNFREAVVLITQPEQGGPFGVIINRPMAHRLAEIFPNHESLRKRPDTLFFGGPVAPNGLVFLLRGAKPPPRAARVLKDVYLTTHPDTIDDLLNRTNPTQGLRVYGGYAGWAPGQLQAEIDRGSWHVLPADAETIFEADPKTIWTELTRRATLRSTRADGAAQTYAALRPH